MYSWRNFYYKAPQGQKFDPQTGQPIVHVQMSQEEMNMKMLQMTAQKMPPQQPMQSKQETVVQIQAADGGGGVPMDPPADTNSLMVSVMNRTLPCRAAIPEYGTHNLCVRDLTYSRSHNVCVRDLTCSKITYVCVLDLTYSRSHHYCVRDLT